MHRRPSATHITLHPRAWPRCGRASRRLGEIGATGGMTNARGLARIYAGVPGLVGPDTLVRMGRVHSATGQDGDRVCAHALRARLRQVNRQSPSATRHAFGHSGFGGSVGFLDPRAGFAFGYAMNRVGQGTGINERGQSLVDAVYETLGYASNASGSWA